MPLRSSRPVRSALVALTVAVATAGGAVAVAGPAAATSDSCQTTTTLTVNGRTGTVSGRYGSDVNLAAAVAVGTCQLGTQSGLAGGTLEIQRSVGGGAWTTVQTVDVADGVTSTTLTVPAGGSVVPKLTHFQAVYSGGTSPEPAIDTFGASSSTAPTYFYPWRAITEKSSHCGRRGCTDVWKFTPASSIKGLKILVQHKTSRGWHTVTRIKASAGGTIKHTFPPGRNQLVAPTARGYLASYVWWTVRKPSHARMIRES